MRYYKVMGIGHDVDADMFSEMKVLYGQLDGEAMVMPYYRGGFYRDDDGASVKPNLMFAVITAGSDIERLGVERILQRAFDMWGVGHVDVVSVDECTFRECFDEGSRFRSEFYSHDARALMNLGTFYRFMTKASHTGIREHLIGGKVDAATAFERADGTAHAQGLRAELERIFARTADGSDGRSGRIPVHYVIEGGSATDADATVNILLTALRSTGRLDSRHVFTFDLDDRLGWDHIDDEVVRLLMSEQTIRAMDGNALVVRYGALDGEGIFDLTSHRMLGMLVDLLNSTENSIQVVFSVPAGKTEVVRRLRTSFDLPLVHIAYDAGMAASCHDLAGAAERMRLMAHAQGVAADADMDRLLCRRMDAHGTVVVEEVYAEWLALREARDRHPEYAPEIEAAISVEDAAGGSALDRLERLIGLDDAKRLVRDVVKRIRMNRRLMERGLPTQPFSLNMVFAGAPGTGKTEVAHLYAEVLKEARVLREGRLVSVSGAKVFDVDKAFKAAAGSVLFIDEAYSMLGWSDGIASLIANMEQHRHDTVVILAGYEGHMNALLDSNPGFRSRIGFTVPFPDYTGAQLLEIFELLCRNGGMRLASGVRERVRDIIERSGRRTDQGNARFIRKLYEDAVGAQQVRLSDWDAASLSEDDLLTLTLDDVPEAPGCGMGSRPAREELAGLVGLSEVKRLVSSRLDLARMQKVRRDAGLVVPSMPLHMAFKGAPGTGKTEVARLVARILREEGVLSVGRLFECGAHDLLSGMPGTSGDLVADLFQQARGSVIFIDEAYALLYGGAAGDEAIATIIDQMEKLRDEVVVIFAGYADKIEQLFAANPGFASRVKAQMSFPDYGTDELMRILDMMVADRGLTLGRGAVRAAHATLERIAGAKEGGNARAVRNLLEQALLEQSVRLARRMDAAGADGGAASPRVRQLRTLTASDIERAAAVLRGGPKGAGVGFCKAA